MRRKAAHLFQRGERSKPAGYVVVASPAWLAASPAPATPGDLPAQDCIRVRLPNGALFRWPFERDGEQVLVDARGRLTLDEAAIARAAVLNGAGIGFFIEQDVTEDIAAGRLIRLLEDWTPPRPASASTIPGAGTRRRASRLPRHGAGDGRSASARVSDRLLPPAGHPARASATASGPAG